MQFDSVQLVAGHFDPLRGPLLYAATRHLGRKAPFAIHHSREFERTITPRFRTDERQVIAQGNRDLGRRFAVVA